MSLAASLIESRIQLQEENRMEGQSFSVKLWWNDLKEAAAYLRRERGLRSIYSYVATSMGVGMGYSSLLVAFFRVTPGFTTAMYSLFSVAEFAGRTLGGLVHYNVKMAPIPSNLRFTFPRARFSPIGATAPTPSLQATPSR